MLWQINRNENETINWMESRRNAKHTHTHRTPRQHASMHASALMCSAVAARKQCDTEMNEWFARRSWTPSSPHVLVYLMFGIRIEFNDIRNWVICWWFIVCRIWTFGVFQYSEDRVFGAVAKQKTALSRVCVAQNNNNYVFFCEKYWKRKFNVTFVWIYRLWELRDVIKLSHLDLFAVLKTITNVSRFIVPRIHLSHYATSCVSVDRSTADI